MKAFAGSLVKVIGVMNFTDGFDRIWTNWAEVG
jgi:hypothetical protein